MLELIYPFSVWDIKWLAGVRKMNVASDLRITLPVHSIVSAMLKFSWFGKGGVLLEVDKSQV